MKTSAIIRIVLFSMIALGLVALLIIGISHSDWLQQIFHFESGSFYTYNDSELYTVGSGGKNEVAADDITEIEINWVAGAVNLSPYSGNTVTFEESASRSLQQDEQLRYRVDGNKLIIQFCSSKKSLFNFGTSIQGKALDVQIPASLLDKLDNIQISSVSSKVTISSLATANIDIDTVSGAAELNDIQCSELSVNTTSGAVTASNITADSFGIETVSGRVTAQGKIKSFDSETVSGEVDFNCAALPDEIDIETVSGSSRITLPENDGFTAKFDTVSGRFSSDFEVTSKLSDKDVYYYENGDDCSISINSVSGSAQILKG